MIRFLFIWMLLLGTLMPSFAEAATPFSEKAAKLSGITAVRMAGSMERLRIVLDANKEVDYSVMVLANPSRVVVDLHGAWLSPNVARETVIQPPDRGPPEGALRRLAGGDLQQDCVQLRGSPSPEALHPQG